MSALRDIYRPPGAGAPLGDGAPAIALLRRNAGVLAGCLSIGSLLWGLVEGIRGGFALRVFDAEDWIAGVVAMGALRLDGAGISASAAAITIVVASHRLAIDRSAPPRTLDLWPILVATPLLAPIAGCLITLAALGVAALGFGVGPSVSLSSLGELLYLGDPLVGVGFGGALALLLLGAAHAMKAHLGRTRGRTARLFVAVLLTQGTAAVVNHVVSSREFQGVDPFLQRALSRTVD